jgi:hypothetical protein
MSIEVFHVRASRLPFLKLCSMSVEIECAPIDKPPNHDDNLIAHSQAAMMGSAWHFVAELMAKNIDLEPKKHEIAANYHVPLSVVDEAIDSFAFLREMHGKPNLTKIIAEYANYYDFHILGDDERVDAQVRVSAHIDLIVAARAGGAMWNAEVMDWKTGLLDSAPVEDNLQMRVYGLIAPKAVGQLRFISTSIFYPRRGIMDSNSSVPWGDFEIESVQMITPVLKKAIYDPEFVTGPHCKFCPRVANCPAAKDLLQRALRIMHEPDELKPQNTNQFEQLLEKREILKYALEITTDAVSQYIGGIATPTGEAHIVLSNGKHYTRRRIKSNVVTEPSLVWDIAKEAPDAVSVSFGKLKKALVEKTRKEFGGKFKRGERKLAESEAHMQLLRSGAIGQREYFRDDIVTDASAPVVTEEE